MSNCAILRCRKADTDDGRLRGSGPVLTGYSLVINPNRQHPAKSGGATC